MMEHWKRVIEAVSQVLKLDLHVEERLEAGRMIDSQVLRIGDGSMK